MTGEFPRERIGGDLEFIGIRGHDVDLILDRIAALWPVPTPPPTIDRDALRLQVWKAVTKQDTGDQWIDYITACILALLRPADGAVTLTADEAGVCAATIRITMREGLERLDPRWTKVRQATATALAEKLEAAS